MLQAEILCLEMCISIQIATFCQSAIGHDVTKTEFQYTTIKEPEVHSGEIAVAAASQSDLLTGHKSS